MRIDAIAIYIYFRHRLFSAAYVIYVQYTQIRYVLPTKIFLPSLWPFTREFVSTFLFLRRKVSLRATKKVEKEGGQIEEGVENFCSKEHTYYVRGYLLVQQVNEQRHACCMVYGRSRFHPSMFGCVVFFFSFSIPHLSIRYF